MPTQVLFMISVACYGSHVHAQIKIINHTIFVFVDGLWLITGGKYKTKWTCDKSTKCFVMILLSNKMLHSIELKLVGAFGELYLIWQLCPGTLWPIQCL